MTDPDLVAKQAYFDELKLLDTSDDEGSNGDVFDRIESVMAEMQDPKPPRLARQTSSFLGPTPKEVKDDFEAHTARRRAVTRNETRTISRSVAAPEVDLTQSFPVTKPRARQLSIAEGESNSKMKRVASLPNMTGLDQTPFYKQMGVVPRELKNGKNVKPADNIKLLPESHQLLRGKIIYFYPNDDVSMRKVVLAKFDPYVVNSSLMQTLLMERRYIPQCIQFGTLMDPSAARFSVKGAPQRAPASQVADTPVSEASGESQRSLQIKPTRKQRDAVPSQKTDSVPTEGTPSQAEKVPESPMQERVEDSFVLPSSEPGEDPAEPANPDAAFGNELLQAIRETKAIAHLPIDDDDEEGSPTPSVIGMEGADSGDSGTDEEPLEVPKKLRKKDHTNEKSKSTRPTKKGFDQSGFQCMDPSISEYNSQNPNARTIQILEEMGRHYDQMQDTWRTLAYRRGVTTLKKQTTKISTAKQAAALPFIGSRLAEKIEEIVLTNRLHKLDNTKDDPLDQVLRLFLGVYGCGLVQANKWIQAGHRTLSDLTKAKLTHSQRIGIEHYTDFNSRIPRAEVAAHGAVVTTALKPIDKNFEATVMGSYRRGAKDSGDIDMIITHPTASLAQIRSTVFNTLVPSLFRTGFLKASLATMRKHDTSGTKWHGASCLPGSSVWRRMDFLVVPEAEMGAALLYFTGNDVFNRSMRLLARKKGMRLNQKGLYKGVKRGKRGEKLNEGTLVEGKSERRIFEVLGVPWREPHERIC
ncbi:hypothetical protein N0V91_011375 [Didymella pomorum]|uniref:DNA-directed DNA polymerase n=1 Tax=Didymella pomorum TaxID=749634 RepID=A0A9W8YVK5_9PLEO|nr:hypothetical protein N0V91_011375 [Didymella pomorum]